MRSEWETTSPVPRTGLPPCIEITGSSEYLVSNDAAV